MKHHCVNLGMAQTCSKYVKTCQDMSRQCLYVTLTYSTRKPVQHGSTGYFPFPERLHNVAQVYRRCENLPLLSLFHFCFISGIGQAVPPYPSRHRCQTFFLICTTQGVHKATEPILQHLQWRPQRIPPLERCIVALPARTCQGVNFLMPPGCISSFLPAAGKSLRCRHKSSSKPHSANHALLDNLNPSATWMSKEIAKNLQGMRLFCPLPGASLSAYCSTGNSLTLKFT